MTERLTRELGLEGRGARNWGLGVARVLARMDAGGTRATVEGIEGSAHTHAGLVAENVGNRFVDVSVRQAVAAAAAPAAADGSSKSVVTVSAA